MALVVPPPATPSPPTFGPRRRGPGALLRDERRRLLRIAPDVLAPPPAVYCPSTSAPHVSAQVPGPELVARAANPPPGLRVLADGATEQLLLVVPPSAAPSPPTFGPAAPAALRLRTWGQPGIPQLDGNSYDFNLLTTKVKCEECSDTCYAFNFEKEGWLEQDVRTARLFGYEPRHYRSVWCAKCQASSEDDDD